MGEIKVNKLDSARAIYTPSGDVVIKQISDRFYEELDEDFSDFQGHVLISQFSFDEPWGVWEMHPKGDELVYLLSGSTEFILHDGNEIVERVEVNEPGSYVVVPKGMWHTANPKEATTMFFVTPGEGTVNALQPGGEPI